MAAPTANYPGPGNDGLPAWSPDGQQIAYVSDMAAVGGIYVVSATGGMPRNSHALGWQQPPRLAAGANDWVRKAFG